MHERCGKGGGGTPAPVLSCFGGLVFRRSTRADGKFVDTLSLAERKGAARVQPLRPRKVTN